jgi:4-hydroxybenzoate polyprenyltransferase
VEVTDVTPEAKAKSMRGGWAVGLIRGMRPKQWTKNGFVFLPILFDRQISLSNPDPLFRVLLTAFLFCLAASAVYLMNDAVDVERDRLHPKKRNRPIASGQLPIQIAVIAAIILPIITLFIAIRYLNIGVTLILFAYLAKQVAYSFYFKHVVILDVIVLAAGYVMRVLAGATVIVVTSFSPWLYVCIGALALFLAVGKRRQEMIKLGSVATDVRATYKEYNMALLDDMMRLVTTSTLISYTLYTVEAKTALAGPTMLLTVPFAVYGIFRYLYLMHVKGEGGAPDELLFKDKPLLIVSVLFLVVAGALIYFRPDASIYPTP